MVSHWPVCLLLYRLRNWSNHLLLGLQPMSNLLFAQTRLPFSAARLEVSQIRNQAPESVPVFSFSFAFYGGCCNCELRWSSFLSLGQAARQVKKILVSGLKADFRVVLKVLVIMYILWQVWGLGDGTYHSNITHILNFETLPNAALELDSLLGIFHSVALVLLCSLLNVCWCWNSHFPPAEASKGKVILSHALLYILIVTDSWRWKSRCNERRTVAVLYFLIKQWKLYSLCWWDIIQYWSFRSNPF